MSQSPRQTFPAVPDGPLPADLGFVMPAEWQPHAATWTSWPFDDELWEGYLEAARQDVARLVAAIARFEPVQLNVVDDDAEADARRRLDELGATRQVHFVRRTLDDIWFRDNGPTFVRNASARVAMVHWRFNGWGEKYAWQRDATAPAALAAELGMRRFAAPLVAEGGALEVNAAGLCLTTRSCLLHPKRNPDRSEAEIGEILRGYLGVRRVAWLDSGLEGDHTDGHIDTLARFTDDRTIVCVVSDDPDDPNQPVTHANLAALRALRDPDGLPYRVLELPLPRERRMLGDRRLPLTYANFYIGNGFVVVPTYGDPHDELALEILRPLFPDRELLALPASGLITGGGAFHCITQQQPQGEIASAGGDRR